MTRETEVIAVTTPVRVTFRDMEPSEAVEAAIRARADKLDRFFDRIVDCHVIVETPHRHHHKGRVHQIKIHLTVPGTELVADHEPDRAEHEDIYVSIRDAFGAIERQLRAHAEKQRHH